MSNYATMNDGVQPSGFTKIAASENITATQVITTAPRDANDNLTAYNIGIVVPSVSDVEVNAIAAGAEANNPVPTILWNNDEGDFVGISPTGDIIPFGANPNSNFYGGVVLNTGGSQIGLRAGIPVALNLTGGASWGAGPLSGFTAVNSNSALHSNWGDGLEKNQAVSVHLNVNATVDEAIFAVSLFANGSPIPGLTSSVLLASKNGFYNVNFSLLLGVVDNQTYALWVSSLVDTDINVGQASITFAGV